MSSAHETATEIVTNVTREGISTDEMIGTYSEWARNYDKDVVAYGRKTPEETVSSITRIETNKDSLILDVAAGTGIVGEMLKNNGFTNMDALDASAEMLEIAKAKKIYNKTFCQFVTSEESPNLATNLYDVVVCVGAFYPGHLDHTCFPELIRILKKGGRFYFTRPCHKLPGDIEIAIDEVEKQGMLKIFEKRFVKDITTHGDGYVFVLQKC